MTYTLHYPGGLQDRLELVSKTDRHGSLRLNGKVLLTRPTVWKRLLDSGRVVEVRNG